MNQLEPRVSVIIPVYNAEEQLHQCLDSVMNQTLGEIEIICVDDASTDQSNHILHDYKALDSRIRLIEKEKNGGAVCARRTGVLESRGRFIMYADPDDYLEPDACRIAYNKICESQVDILQFTCGVEDYDNDESVKKWLAGTILESRGSGSEQERASGRPLQDTNHCDLFIW